MGEKIEVKSRRLEFVGNDGDTEVWEVPMNPIKSKKLKEWGTEHKKRVLGIQLTRSEMPLIKITFEKMEE